METFGPIRLEEIKLDMLVVPVRDKLGSDVPPEADKMRIEVTADEVVDDAANIGGLTVGENEKKESVVEDTED